MKRIAQLLFFLLVSCALSAQEIEVKREREFTGSGLYGFMNGGADQFLEYGVSKLITRDVVYKDNEYTIDIYDMPSPEDAFGIYSLHIFRCGRADTLGCIDCMAPYQLQAVAGNKYVSLVFPSGSANARNNADELIRRYVPMDGKSNPRIPDMLQMEAPLSGRIKLLRGPISVSGVSMPLARLLDGVSYTGVWFIADKPSRSFRALIETEGKEEKEKLQSKVEPSDIIQSGDSFLYIKGKEKAAGKENHGGFGF